MPQHRDRVKSVVTAITVFLLSAAIAIPVLSSSGNSYDPGHNGASGYSVSVSYQSGTSVNPNGNLTAKTPGFVRNTLVLFNNTLLPGNVQYTRNGSLNPAFMALDNRNGLIYVTDETSHNLTVINPSLNRVQASINLGSNSSGITYDPVNGLLYIITDNRNITVVSPSEGKTVDTISPGAIYMEYIATDPVSGNVYACDFGNPPALYQSVTGSTVFVINHVTQNISANITVPANADCIAFDPANHYMYVTSVNNCYVTFINTTTDTVAGHIYNIFDHFGNLEWPGPIAFNPSTGSMIVESLWDGTTISINSTTNHATQITSQVMGQQSAYDPVNGYMYTLYSPGIPGWLGGVQQFNSNDGNVVSHYFLGMKPTGIVYDPQNSLIYVSNMQSGSISIIQTVGPNNVTFKEWGLAPGAHWTLKYGQTTVFLNETPFALNLPNGDFNYTLQTPGGYTLFQGKSGHLVLSGENVTVSYTFLADPYLASLVILPVAIAIAAVFLYLVRQKKS